MSEGASNASLQGLHLQKCELPSINAHFQKKYWPEEKRLSFEQTAFLVKLKFSLIMTLNIINENVMNNTNKNSLSIITKSTTATSVGLLLKPLFCLESKHA